jgi:hypothetical protein
MIRTFLIAVTVSAVALASCSKQPAPASKAPAIETVATTPAKTPAPRSAMVQTNVGPVTAPPPAPAEPAPKRHFSSARMMAFRMGNAIGPRNDIAGEPKTMFASNDTIYAVVSTMSPQSKQNVLKARWTYQDGQLVNESSKNVPGGTRFSEFHISKSDGWPSGSYSVTILADEDPLVTKTFQVQ